MPTFTRLSAAIAAAAVTIALTPAAAGADTTNGPCNTPMKKVMALLHIAC